MIIKDVPSKMIPIETEDDARLHLAAVYRLLAHFGMSDLVYNHVTLRVPGPEERWVRGGQQVEDDEGDQAHPEEEHDHPHQPSDYVSDHY